MFLLFWATKTLDFARQPRLRDRAAPVGDGVRAARSGAASGSRPRRASCCSSARAASSAQLPLYVWLPDAMAGPTPVSALIHAATMVTAGVYMVCRLSFLYSASTTALIVVATVGLLTALAAAFMAFAQTDLKKVLAYSTVSQLGFMFVAAGTGNWAAAIFHLGTHAFFKACLFLGAGSVMHGMEHGGSTTPGDITKMGGLRKHMPITRHHVHVSCLAIAGIFPFAGLLLEGRDPRAARGASIRRAGRPCYGKVLWAGLLDRGARHRVLHVAPLLPRVRRRGAHARRPSTRTSRRASMTLPLVVLAFFATVVGFLGLPHLERHRTCRRLRTRCRELARAERGAHLVRARMAPTHARSMAHGSATARRSSLMGVALAIGVLGIGIAWMLYGRGPSPTVERLVDGPLARRSTRRRSTSCGSTRSTTRSSSGRSASLARGLFEIVDRFIIDTVAVNGSAFVVGLFGRVSRWFQNGQVQRYLAGLVVGAARGLLRHRLPPASRRSSYRDGRRPARAPRRARRRHRRRDARSSAGTSTATACPTRADDRQAARSRPTLYVRAGDVGAR